MSATGSTTGPITLRDDGIAVADDVLPAEAFAELQRHVARADYRSVHAQGWDKAWPLWDGSPLRGTSIHYDPEGAFGSDRTTYPTSTAVDRLVDAVRQVSARCTDIAGAEGVDWVGLFLAPWLYPVGSALSLHCDGGGYTGSFTFFAHPRWGRHWGGDLVVSRPGPGATPPARLSGDEGDPSGDDPGIGLCISPRPNRLVVLGADRPHRISRVDVNAGQHVRASVAGFFLRPP
jgi:hypothetical protein